MTESPTLRDYQEDVVHEVLELFYSKCSSVMVRLPTGSGKSVVGAAIVASLGRSSNAWLTHRSHLSEQSAKHLEEAGLRTLIMGEFASHERQWFKHAVTVVSPALRAVPDLPRQPGVLVVDEAHHAIAKTWERLIRAWIAAGGLVLGLTATPWRMNRNQGFDDLFAHMVEGPTIAALQEMGHLAAPLVEVPQAAQMDCAAGRIGSNGDYAVDWMESETIMMLAQTPVLEHWHTRTQSMPDCRTLWFAPSVPAAHELHSKLADSAVLLGETGQEERERVFRGFKCGDIQHVVSVDVIGEGYDVPEVPVIASLRPTRSLAVWLQQCGRGARPKAPTDTAPGGHYLVLDYATNSWRHGSPEVDREWSLLPRAKQNGAGGDAPVATCVEDDCGAVLHPAHRECWLCSAPQFVECPECHRDRRESVMGAADMCPDCDKLYKHLAAQERRQEFHEQRRASNTPVATCVEDSCGTVLHPSDRECWLCSAPQFVECPECHRDRRGSVMGAADMCPDCDKLYKHLAAQERRQEFHEQRRASNAEYWRRQQGKASRGYILLERGKVSPYRGKQETTNKQTTKENKHHE